MSSCIRRPHVFRRSVPAFHLTRPSTRTTVTSISGAPRHPCSYTSRATTALHAALNTAASLATQQHQNFRYQCPRGMYDILCIDVVIGRIRLFCYWAVYDTFHSFYSILSIPATIWQPTQYSHFWCSVVLFTLHCVYFIQAESDSCSSSDYTYKNGWNE